MGSSLGTTVSFQETRGNSNQKSPPPKMWWSSFFCKRPVCSYTNRHTKAICCWRFCSSFSLCFWWFCLCHSQCAPSLRTASKARAWQQCVGPFWFVATLGECPVFMCGDFQMNASHSKTLSSALASGEWSDIAYQIAHAHGHEPQPTFVRNRRSKTIATRIVQKGLCQTKCRKSLTSCFHAPKDCRAAYSQK